MPEAAPAVAKSAPKKVAVKKVKKAAPSHPKYSVMVAAAIASLKERSGSSRQAIVKYIVANHKVDEKTASVHVKLALKRGVVSKELKQVKGVGASGSFRLNKPESGKPKKPAAKKAAAKKPAVKKAAKKLTAKKSLTPKKVAKPKSVKKPAKKPVVAKKLAAKKSAKPKKPTAKKIAKK